MMYTGSW